MDGTLAHYVHLLDDDGTRHQFGPGDDVPDWAAARITNPKAWARAADAAEDPDGDARDDAASGDTAEGESAGPVAERPPARGAGSGREAWAAYAAALGVEVSDEMTQKDLIAACEAREG